MLRSLLLCFLLLAAPALAQQNINYQPPPPGQLGLIATGTNQATALQLPAALNVFASVPVGTGARPPSVPTSVTVVNQDAANALLLYPPAGDQIIGYAVNAAVSVPAGQQATLTWFGSALSPTPRQWILNGPNGAVTGPATFNGTVNAVNSTGYLINGNQAINVTGGNLQANNSPHCIGNCQTKGGALAGGNVPSTDNLFTGFGYNAGGQMNSTAGNGAESTVFGWNAAGQVTGSSSYFITSFGINNEGSCTTGCNNLVTMGTDALRDALTPTKTIAIGPVFAGQFSNGDSNIYIGSNVGQGGCGSGCATFTGGNNVAIGFGTFQATNATSATIKNVLVGNDIANGCTTCNDLSVLGYGAGEQSSSQNFSVFVGTFAGQNEQTGASNTDVGSFACGTASGSSSFKTCVGRAAGYKLTGSSVVAIGYNVAQNAGSSGSGIILIGTSNSCDTPATNTGNYIGICGPNGTIISVTGADTAGTSFTTVAGEFVSGGGTQFSALTLTTGFFHFPFTNATSGAGGIPTGTPATPDGDACVWNDVTFVLNCYSASAAAWKHAAFSASAG